MAVLVVLIVIAAVASQGGDDEDTATDTPTGQDGGDGEDEGPETATLGEPVRDGKFEFTVNSFECGVSSVGDEFLSEEPQGQFCLLTLRVENIGDQAQALFADDQYLLEEDGTQHSAPSVATSANDPEGETLFSEINPGNAIEGTIVFDVPSDANIGRAELHDSAFSGGVEVAVR